MSRSTRLYTLCVLLLLAVEAPTALARVERVPRSVSRPLDRRQGGGGAFGGLFGGGRGSTTDTTSATATATATTPTSATTSPGTDAQDANSLASASSSSTTTGSGSLNLLPLPTLFSSSHSHSDSALDDISTSSLPPLSSETSRISQIIVTVTSIVTNADGSHSTMEMQSASAVATKQDNSSGPSGKTWGIIGGVVGGVAVLIGAILVLWRCTQRRFDSLDGGVDEIKWPELQPDGQTVSAGLSTLNPAATRRTGRAGIEMEKDDGSEWGDDSPRLGSRPEANDSRYFDGFSGDPFSDNGGSGVASAGGDPRRGSYYDDPFQGHAATPYPPRRPTSNVPYGQYDAAISNPSFRSSHLYASNERLPLVGHGGPGGPGLSGEVPILRVSSPESQRHF